jgi:hypothetical protein
MYPEFKTRGEIEKIWVKKLKEKDKKPSIKISKSLENEKNRYWEKGNRK